jgi:hypothetical protein
MRALMPARPKDDSMRRDSRPALAIALAALMLTPAGCGGAYSTPEACFNSLRAAAQKKDVPAMMDCITEESQSVLAGGLVMMGAAVKFLGGMVTFGGDLPGNPKQYSDAVAEILEKHDITKAKLDELGPVTAMAPDAGAVIKLGDLIANKPAFVADMFSVMEQFNQNGINDQLETQLAGTLKDVKIDGDAATATVVTTRGEDQLDFRKTAAGWKIHFDLNKLPGPGPGDAGVPPS